MATSDTNRKSIEELLAGIEKPVRLVHFTQTVECEPCQETKRLYFWTLSYVCRKAKLVSRLIHREGEEPEVASAYRSVCHPNLPLLPAAPQLAHQLAIENGLVIANMVEATEFPGLVQRYAIRGVPKTLINGTASIEGSLPEPDYVDRIIGSVTPANVHTP